jgi:hypothetical protein
MKFATLVLLLGPLVACSGNDPDCATGTSKNLVVKIIRETENGGLVTSTFWQLPAYTASGREHEIAISNLNKTFKARREKVQTELNDLFSGPSLQTARRAGLATPPGAVELQRERNKIDIEYLAAAAQTNAEKDARLKDLKSRALAAARIELSAIRMTRKNSDTGAVACIADLHIEMESAKSDSAIEYQIERTSDGNLYATIYGL